MEPRYVKLASTILYYHDKSQKAVIDHQVDEESEYTGCYRITLDDGSVINVEVDADGKWTELNKGATEISQTIGRLIEQYHE